MKEDEFIKLEWLKKNCVKQGLSARLADYRAAYSTANPFTIHLLYEVPMGVQGKRPNFTYLTEARIHLTLKKMKVWQDGEWYYLLKDIINIISSIKLEHLLDPVLKNKKWEFYSTQIGNEILPLIPDSDVPSKLTDIIALTTQEKGEIFRKRKEDVNYTGETIEHRTNKKLTKKLVN